MLKYIILSLFSLNITAAVVMHDGKPFMSLTNGVYPLEQFELTPRTEARLFAKDLTNDLVTLGTRPPQLRVDLKPHMSRVKDQRVRSNCSAFQAIGMVEHYLGKTQSLSEQCLVYFSGAQDPGDPYHRLKHMQEHGINYETDCPYVDPSRFSDWDPTDPDGNKKLIERAINTIPDLTDKTVATLNASVVSRNVDDMSPSDSVNYIRNKVHAGIPVGISVFVAGDGWHTGVLDKIPSDDEIKQMCPPKASSANPTKHCNGHGIIVTGFDDNRRVFYFKNSWDQDWGVNQNYAPENYPHKKIGYGVMSYEHFARFAVGRLLTLE